MVRHNDFPLKEWHIEHMKKTVVKFIENMQIKSGTWQCDTIRNILTITDSETKKRSVLMLIKLDVYECVLEYRDPERSGLIMHMIPKY